MEIDDDDDVIIVQNEEVVNTVEISSKNSKDVNLKRKLDKIKNDPNIIDLASSDDETQINHSKLAKTNNKPQYNQTNELSGKVRPNAGSKTESFSSVQKQPKKRDYTSLLAKCNTGKSVVYKVPDDVDEFEQSQNYIPPAPESICAADAMPCPILSKDQESNKTILDDLCINSGKSNQNFVVVREENVKEILKDVGKARLINVPHRSKGIKRGINNTNNEIQKDNECIDLSSDNECSKNLTLGRKNETVLESNTLGNTAGSDLLQNSKETTDLALDDFSNGNLSNNSVLDTEKKNNKTLLVNNVVPLATENFVDGNPDNNIAKKESNNITIQKHIQKESRNNEKIIKAPDKIIVQQNEIICSSKNIPNNLTQNILNSCNFPKVSNKSNNNPTFIDTSINSTVTYISKIDKTTKKDTQTNKESNIQGTCVKNKYLDTSKKTVPVKNIKKNPSCIYNTLRNEQIIGKVQDTEICIDLDSDDDGNDNFNNKNIKNSEFPDNSQKNKNNPENNRHNNKEKSVNFLNKKYKQTEKQTIPITDQVLQSKLDPQSSLSKAIKNRRYVTIVEKNIIKEKVDIAIQTDAANVKKKQTVILAKNLLSVPQNNEAFCKEVVEIVSDESDCGEDAGSHGNNNDKCILKQKNKNKVITNLFQSPENNFKPLVSKSTFPIKEKLTKENKSKVVVKTYSLSTYLNKVRCTDKELDKDKGNKPKIQKHNNLISADGHSNLTTNVSLEESINLDLSDDEIYHSSDFKVSPINNVTRIFKSKVEPSQNTNLLSKISSDKTKISECNDPLEDPLALPVSSADTFNNPITTSKSNSTESGPDTESVNKIILVNHLNSKLNSVSADINYKNTRSDTSPNSVNQNIAIPDIFTPVDNVDVCKMLQTASCAQTKFKKVAPEQVPYQAKEVVKKFLKGEKKLVPLVSMSHSGPNQEVWKNTIQEDFGNCAISVNKILPTLEVQPEISSITIENKISKYTSEMEEENIVECEDPLAFPAETFDNFNESLVVNKKRTESTYKLVTPEVFKKINTQSNVNAPNDLHLKSTCSTANVSSNLAVEKIVISDVYEAVDNTDDISKMVKVSQHCQFMPKLITRQEQLKKNTKLSLNQNQGLLKNILEENIDNYSFAVNKTLLNPKNQQEISAVNVKNNVSKCTNANQQNTLIGARMLNIKESTNCEKPLEKLIVLACDKFNQPLVLSEKNTIGASTSHDVVIDLDDTSNKLSNSVVQNIVISDVFEAVDDMSDKVKSQKKTPHQTKQHVSDVTSRKKFLKLAPKLNSTQNEKIFDNGGNKNYTHTVKDSTITHISKKKVVTLNPCHNQDTSKVIKKVNFGKKTPSGNQIIKLQKDENIIQLDSSDDEESLTKSTTEEVSLQEITKEKNLGKLCNKINTSVLAKDSSGKNVVITQITSNIESGLGISNMEAGQKLALRPLASPLVKDTTKCFISSSTNKENNTNHILSQQTKHGLASRNDSNSTSEIIITNVQGGVKDIINALELHNIENLPTNLRFHEKNINNKSLNKVLDSAPLKESEQPTDNFLSLPNDEIPVSSFVILKGKPVDESGESSLQVQNPNKGKSRITVRNPADLMKNVKQNSFQNRTSYLQTDSNNSFIPSGSTNSCVNPTMSMPNYEKNTVRTLNALSVPNSTFVLDSSQTHYNSSIQTNTVFLQPISINSVVNPVASISMNGKEAMGTVLVPNSTFFLGSNVSNIAAGSGNVNVLYNLLPTVLGQVPPAVISPQPLPVSENPHLLTNNRTCSNNILKINQAVDPLATETDKGAVFNKPKENINIFLAPSSAPSTSVTEYNTQTFNYIPSTLAQEVRSPINMLENVINLVNPTAQENAVFHQPLIGSTSLLPPRLQPISKNYNENFNSSQHYSSSVIENRSNSRPVTITKSSAHAGTLGDVMGDVIALFDSNLQNKVPKSVQQSIEVTKPFEPITSSKKCKTNNTPSTVTSEFSLLASTLENVRDQFDSNEQERAIVNQPMKDLNNDEASKDPLCIQSLANTQKTVSRNNPVTLSSPSLRSPKVLKSKLKSYPEKKRKHEDGEETEKALDKHTVVTASDDNKKRESNDIITAQTSVIAASSAYENAFLESLRTNPGTNEELESSSKKCLQKIVNEENYMYYCTVCYFKTTDIIMRHQHACLEGRQDLLDILGEQKICNFCNYSVPSNHSSDFMALTLHVKSCNPNLFGEWNWNNKRKIENITLRELNQNFMGSRDLYAFCPLCPFNFINSCQVELYRHLAKCHPNYSFRRTNSNLLKKFFLIDCQTYNLPVLENKIPINPNPYSNQKLSFEKHFNDFVSKLSEEFIGMVASQNSSMLKIPLPDAICYYCRFFVCEQSNKKNSRDLILEHTVKDHSNQTEQWYERNNIGVYVIMNPFKSIEKGVSLHNITKCYYCHFFTTEKNCIKRRSIIIEHLTQKHSNHITDVLRWHEWNGSFYKKTVVNKCAFCDFITTTTGLIKTHLKNCSYKLARTEKINEEKEHDVTEKINEEKDHDMLSLKLFQCRYCTYFSYKDRISTHIRKKHLKFKEYFQCRFCNAGFKMKQELMMHFRVYHKGITIQRNMIIPRYKCVICKMEFALKYRVQKHLDTQHIHYDRVEVTVDEYKKMHGSFPIIQCSDCDFKCKYESELLRHKNKCSKKLPEENDDGRTNDVEFKCLSCGFKAVDDATLNIHKIMECSLTRPPEQENLAMPEYTGAKSATTTEAKLILSSSSICPICGKVVKGKILKCDSECETMYHFECVHRVSSHVNPDEINENSNWFCFKCTQKYDIQTLSDITDSNEAIEFALDFVEKKALAEEKKNHMHLLNELENIKKEKLQMKQDFEKVKRFVLKSRSEKINNPISRIVCNIIDNYISSGT